MQGKNAILEMIASGDTAEALNNLLAMDMLPKDRTVLVQIKASYEQLQRDSRLLEDLKQEGYDFGE